MFESGLRLTDADERGVCEGLFIEVTGCRNNKSGEELVTCEKKAIADYIELAREFQTIIISNVPVLGKDKDDQARRFINMIDEFYDRNVKVIISADAPITRLYDGGRLEFEFERTESRLLEMQSREYLGAPHLG